MGRKQSADKQHISSGKAADKQQTNSGQAADKQNADSRQATYYPLSGSTHAAVKQQTNSR